SYHVIVIVDQRAARARCAGAEGGSELRVCSSAGIGARNNPQTITGIFRRQSRIVEIRLEVRDLIIGLIRSIEERPPHSEIERQPGSDLPIVGNVELIIMPTQLRPDIR